MGAQTFENKATAPKGTPLDTVFTDAVQDAKNEHGHGGYSGTLAEKHNCILICTVETYAQADRVASDIMNDEDSNMMYREEITQLVADKWGAAGAIRFTQDAKTDGYIFFGWASS